MACEESGTGVRVVGQRTQHVSFITCHWISLTSLAKLESNLASSTYFTRGKRLNLTCTLKAGLRDGELPLLRGVSLGPVEGPRPLSLTSPTHPRNRHDAIATMLSGRQRLS